MSHQQDEMQVDSKPENYYLLESGSQPKRRFSYKWLIPIPILCIVILAAAWIIVDATHNNTYNSCVAMCNAQASSKTSRLCYCRRRTPTANGAYFTVRKTDSKAICAADYKNNLCYTFSNPLADGCPVESNRTTAVNDAPCSLASPECRLLFSQYFNDKFSVGFGTASQLKLNASADLFLYGNTTEAVGDFTDFLTNGLNLTSTPSDNNTLPAIDLTSDYVHELTASQSFYFNFQWMSSPQFAPVLPDDDPLLIPTYTIDTPQRNEWRAWVVEHFLAGGDTIVGRAPRFYFLGGGGGAGKTTIVRLLISQGKMSLNNTVYVNADDIKELDPIYQSIVAAGDYRAASVVHKDSGNLARQLLQRAIAKSADIIYDGTMSTASTAHTLINDLRAANYEISLIGVTIAADEAMRRASSRAVRSKRFVPGDVLLEAHKGFSASFPSYVTEISNVLLYDNTDIPELLAVNDNGQWSVLSEALYEQFINKKLLNDTAENILHLYPATVKPDPAAGLLLGGCTVDQTSFDRYSRLYATMHNTDSDHVCVCTDSDVADKQQHSAAETAAVRKLGSPMLQEMHETITAAAAAHGPQWYSAFDY